MMEYAIEQARLLPFIQGQKRLYSVLLNKRGRVVAEGCNSYIVTHPLMHLSSRKLGLVKDYLHCEVATILKDRHRKGERLITARVDSKGKSCLAAPCPVCLSVIKQYTNIKSVEYTV